MTMLGRYTDFPPLFKIAVYACGSLCSLYLILQKHMSTLPLSARIIFIGKVLLYLTPVAIGNYALALALAQTNTSHGCRIILHWVSGFFLTMLSMHCFPKEGEKELEKVD